MRELPPLERDVLFGVLLFIKKFVHFLVGGRSSSEESELSMCTLFLDKAGVTSEGTFCA